MNIEISWRIFSILLFVSEAFGSNDERNCSKGKAVEPYPATVKNTTVLLANLRQLMIQHKIQGYIVPSQDDHQTEYVAPWFKRREFISGFSGSAGTAVVTMDEAAIWVDGRYFKQAATELDCNWIIMKYGLPKTPKLSDWISAKLKWKTVGADPRVMSLSAKKIWTKNQYLTWKSVDKNLIDEIWTNRPVETTNKIIVQPYKYSGQNFTTKLDNLRGTLSRSNVEGIVVNALDDVAWLLNLRGDDIPYNPFFYSYVIVTNGSATLYVDNRKLNDVVRRHLCPPGETERYCVKVKQYDYKVLKEDIQAMASIWLTTDTNLYVAEAVPEDKQYIDFSPIKLPKAMKNRVELQGMKSANMKDGIAIMEYFVWLKKQIAEKKTVTEMSGQDKLKEFKSKQQNFVSLSFASISGFGSNGAIIHYKARNITNKEITDQSLYLIDSGAQFHEGSTDITRTIHLGTPTAYQKEMYTYVLQGAIGLANSIFPTGTYGRNIDVYAREHLWRKGLGYLHGTGHGIGSFLSIHEGPGRINTGRTAAGEAGLYQGMVYSDEPGYYENGQFGIRLETAVVVVPRKTKYTHFLKKFYGFDVLTFVPFERKLIDVDILHPSEIEWLNNYNKMIRDNMGPEIQRQGKTEVYKYMMKLTEPFETNRQISSASQVSCNNYVIYLFSFMFMLLLSNNIAAEML